MLKELINIASGKKKKATKPAAKAAASAAKPTKKVSSTVTKAPKATKKVDTKSATTKPAKNKATKPAAEKAAPKKATVTHKKPAAAAKKAAPKVKATTKRTSSSKQSAGKPSSTVTKKAQKTGRDIMKPTPEPKKGTLLFGSIEPYRPTKGEEYMSEGQRAHFKHILETWHDDLVAEANRTVHHLQSGGATNLPDPNDRATQEEEFALELRTRDRERKLLKKIAKSLQNLAEDEYGYCETCGEEIGIRRLEARPTATLCIDCKELAEIKEKHVAG